MSRRSALDIFHPAVAEWFTSRFPSPTTPQLLGWPAIARGESTLMLAPTGSGKTLAAFLLVPRPPDVLAGAGETVAVPRPLRVSAQGARRRRRAQSSNAARGHRRRRPRARPGPHDAGHRDPHGRYAGADRTRFGREAADILITTPESLFLLLTSNARERLTSLDTVIIDEIHALVPGKRGAHLALSLERLEALRGDAQRSAAAHRAFGNAAATRGSRPLSWRSDGCPARLPPPRQAASSRSRLDNGRSGTSRRDDAPSGKPSPIGPSRSSTPPRRRQLSLRIEVPVEDMARLPAASAVADDGVPQGPVKPLDLDIGPSTPARAHSRASVDAALRQQPPAGRAAGRRAQRSRRRAARPLAPRLDGPRRPHAKSRSCSRPGAFARWSPRPRWSSASTWAPSISSCRSNRRPRSPAGFSASAARDTRPAPSAKASSSRSSAAISSPAPP